MANFITGNYAPNFLVIPTIENMTDAPPTGTICISGSTIVWYDGSAFLNVTDG